MFLYRVVAIPLTSNARITPIPVMTVLSHRAVQLPGWTVSVVPEGAWALMATTE